MANEHEPQEKQEQPHTVGRSPPESGTRYTAKEIHDTVVAAASDELDRPAAALWWSAVAAGLLICFSFLCAAFLASLTENPLGRMALVAAGYPIGFIFVVLSSTQLFTENTLDPILPVLETPTRETFRKVARLWLILLAGNLVGAVIIAHVLAWLPVVPDWLMPVLDDVAKESTSGGFGRTFLAAIFAGWLIALMAWLISTTQERFTQIVFIWLTTAPISALGFRHSIAGAVESFFRAARGGASWSEMLGDFVVPSTLGNAVGGILLVALLFYGQVRADKRAQWAGRHRPGGFALRRFRTS